MSFVHFGCWNYGKCDLESPTNGMSIVIKKLIQDPSINPDFFVVAGDNYYPKKDKFNRKIFDKEDFDSGMKCIEELMKKTGKPLYMLMGNHDLQYENALFDTEGNKLPQCNLIEKQVAFSKDFNFNSNGFMIPGTNTLCIFINSVLYTSKKSEVLDCVKLYRPEEYGDYETIDKVIEHQEQDIIAIVDCAKTLKIQIKNIVVVAHDPIVTRRIKQKKGIVNDIRKPLLADGIKFLSKLYNMVPEAKKYYLCADTHQYQYGIVKLGDIIIEQYVVGTGGTKCDMEEISNDENEVKIQTEHEISISLQIIETKRYFGYLYCMHEAENLKCEFIDVAPCDVFEKPIASEGGPTREGGRRRKNKTRKKGAVFLQ